MQVGVAAHSECGHDLKFTILSDEFCYDCMQVDFYKYIDVCAVKNTYYMCKHFGGYICHRKPNSPKLYFEVWTQFNVS